MNITCIPYHDWRKIQTEGSRTRDSHIISHLQKDDNVEHLLLVNRPITFLELFLKKRNQKIEGELLFKDKNVHLYKLDDKTYLYDYISDDIFSLLRKGKSWFFDSFSDVSFIAGYKQCLDFLKIEIDVVYSQNIFSSAFVSALSLPSVFDAWDNFLLFPDNSKYELSFRNAYQSLAFSAKVWTTNSQKNIDFYKEHYQVSDCVLIKNGVDISRFQKDYPIPEDLKKLGRSIVGFGGKITHLFNYDFFNYATLNNPDKTFVLVGQILDKQVFKRIIMRKNVHYLGDKKYSDYVSYVTNFDIGIIPYVTDHLEHGADTIKMYEYLASGLQVVGTLGAGMGDMDAFISVANTKEEFSDMVKQKECVKQDFSLPEFYTWKSKTQETLQCLKRVCIDEQIYN